MSSQRHPFQRCLAVLLALVLLTMHMAALVHRVSHAHRGSDGAAIEPWLAVANGAVVTASQWQASKDLHANDPWHSHESTTDCERFDAVASGHALTTSTATASLPPPACAAFARDYVAELAARTPRALARAPPSV